MNEWSIDFLKLKKNNENSKDTIDDLLTNWICSLNFNITENDHKWAKNNEQLMHMATKKWGPMSMTQTIVEAKCIDYKLKIQEDLFNIAQIIALDYMYSIMSPKKHYKITEKLFFEFWNNLKFVNLDSDLHTIYSICTTYCKLIMQKQTEV